MTDIKKHGLSFKDYSLDGESEDYIVAKELIENLFFDMSKLSTKYCNSVFNELPYTFSERCLDSVLLPALSKICDAKVLVEYPVTRQCNNRRFLMEEANGRIDYWCIYKGYSFVIELKHGYDCFRSTSETIKSKVANSWVTMNKQLQSVEKDIKQFEEDTKGVIRLGLHIVTSYSDITPDSQLIRQFRSSVLDISKRFQRDLSKQYPSLKPDVVLCWMIPPRIVLLGEQTFPGLWAIAKVYPKIKHCGANQ